MRWQQQYPVGSGKRHFRFEFGAIILAVGCEWLGVAMDGTGGNTRLLHIFVKVVEFTVAPFIGIFMALILEAPGKRAAAWVLFAHALLEIVLAFTGGIISVDGASVYTHGPLYPIYMAVYFCAIFYSIYAVLRSVRKYQYGGLSFLLGILLFTLSGFLLHILYNSIRLDYLTTAIAAIMLYVFTLDMIQQTDELTGLINRRGYENRLAHMTDPCVILTSHTQRVEELIRDLEKRMEKARREDPMLPVLSIGFAFYDPDLNSPVEAAEAADRMMYQHKLAKKTVRVD